MIRKMRSQPTQSIGSKPQSLIARAIEVAIRSDDIRERPEVGLEESPKLLWLAQVLTQRVPKVLAGRWKVSAIFGSNNSYSFTLFPESDPGELADLDQILPDASRRLNKAVRGLEDKARTGEMAALPAMRISPAEVALLECVLEVEQLAGKVEMRLGPTSHEDPYGVEEGQIDEGGDEGAAPRAQMPRPETCFVLNPPTREALCAIGKPSRPPIPLHGVVTGVQDLATTTGLIINGGRPLPVEGMTREKAIELFKERSEVHGVVVQIAGESVLTEVICQQKLDLGSTEQH